MDFGKDHVFGCGTPFVQERSNIRFEVEALVQYGHMLAPYLATAGVSPRQYLMLWAMRYGGTKTVANLASLAGIDPDLAMDDIHALERDGFVTLEVPPTEFETPQVARTGRYQEVRRALAPVQRRLEYVMHRYSPDPARPWQGPPPRL